MCYPAPGPRCAPHALEKVKTILARIETAKQDGNEQKVAELNLAFKQANKEYLITPGGRRFVEAERQKALAAGNIQKAQELLDYKQRLLEEYRQRKHQLQVSQQSAQSAARNNAASNTRRREQRRQDDAAATSRAISQISTASNTVAAASIAGTISSSY